MMEEICIDAIFGAREALQDIHFTMWRAQDKLLFFFAMLLVIQGGVNTILITTKK